MTSHPCTHGKKRCGKGFTLAELLIALIILGVIATFTIPKVLQAQQNTRYKAQAKAVAAMISEAYMTHKQNNTIPATFKASDLQYLFNYVKENTTGQIDLNPGYGGGTMDCSAAAIVCLELHQGGIVAMSNNRWFGGTDPTGNGFPVHYDPDGKPSEIKSVSFILNYGGRISAWGDSNAGVSNLGGSEQYLENPAMIPDWFSWD